MRTVSSVVAIALLIGVWLVGGAPTAAQVTSNDNTVYLMDNCLPGDPGWANTGGCHQRPNLGDVSAAEFGQLLTSPLITGLVGHPSWRNEPSHLTADSGKRIRVVNRGGRGHTFTKVADFGGGAVPDFNIAMTRAPECPATPPEVKDAVLPGATSETGTLAPGLHKFQCCFHPWMRATIRIQ